MVNAEPAPAAKPLSIVMSYAKASNPGGLAVEPQNQKAWELAPPPLKPKGKKFFMPREGQLFSFF
jgi:hypothetical protein